MKALKGKKKIIIPIILAVAVIAVGTITVRQVSGTGPAVQTFRTVTLEKTDLTNTVNVNGVVESVDSQHIYSSLSYPVSSVHVKVGDTVAEGDLLCELDSTELELSIAQKRASVYQSQQAGEIQVKEAEKALETARENVQNNHDTALINAEINVRKAEEALEAAFIRLENARLDRRSAQDDAKDTGVEMSSTQRALLNKTVQGAYSDYDSAVAALEDAKAAYETAKVHSAQSLEAYEDKLESARAQNNYYDQYLSIQDLERNLGDTRIMAPVSGTVTAVYAEEGKAGNGLLFVIENVDDLQVSTKIKEYDIAQVQSGNPVVIRSDALTGEVYDGTLIDIAPSSLKEDTTASANSSSSGSSTAEFAAKVKVDTAETALRIGMNTRLSIVVESKEQVFAVPYEAITMDETGESVVYIAARQEDDTYIAQAVPVETGMETDFYTEIISERLAEGDRILADPIGITEGMPVVLEDDMMSDMGMPGAAFALFRPEV